LSQTFKYVGDEAAGKGCSRLADMPNAHTITIHHAPARLFSRARDIYVSRKQFKLGNNIVDSTKRSIEVVDHLDFGRFQP
jgi:hypothetical protein